ncbi:hypothetical protein QCA50_009139 [Cerrena zonata]|uniref:Uncharacterized protein n=1 Tax=Cerrena zonata TaxID=2478898 RepID=A0AAW0G9V7_9APHY
MQKTCTLTSNSVGNEWIEDTCQPMSIPPEHSESRHAIDFFHGLIILSARALLIRRRMQQALDTGSSDILRCYEPYKHSSSSKMSANSAIDLWTFSICTSISNFLEYCEKDNVESRNLKTLDDG